MPIVVKDYSWEENDLEVFITVPLKGVKVNRVDIFSSDEYLKVSYPPYIFECLLFAPVDDRTSSASVGNGMVVFKLKKQSPSTWTQLFSNDYSNKTIMREKREEAVRIAQERASEAKTKEAERKREADKYAVNEMIKLESEEKQKIEDLKEAERQKATEELENWKEQQRQEAIKERERLLVEKKENEIIFQNKKLEEKEKLRNQKLKEEKSDDIMDERSQKLPMRQSGSIQVTFTPRVFPTPVRESQTPQEEEWLKKQAEAQRVKEIEDADLTEEEKNPVWMRDKGNAFFKSGDYQAAINAFTHAIRLDSKLPALFSNRGACHLKQRNFIKCIEDCSKAIELLTPPVTQNAAGRLKAHVRRGTAFCQLELYVEGLQDYEAALKIQPNNDQLRQDAEKIRKIIQGTEQS